MTLVIIILLIIVIIGFWGFKCISIVNPDEIGIKIFLGTPDEKASEMGLHLIFWPICKMVKFPKEIMEFQFGVPSTVTKRGRVKGYEDIIEPAEIDLFGTFYAQFDEDKIRKAVQYAPGNTIEKLGPFLTPAVAATTKALVGRIPWRLTNQARYRFEQWITARLTGGIYYDVKGDDKDTPYDFDTDNEKPWRIVLDKEEKEKVITEEGGDKYQLQVMEKVSPFVLIGLKNVSVVFDDLDFTNPGLKDSISGPEKARLDKQSTITEAEGDKQKIILHGEGDAEARKLYLDVIKSTPEMEAIAALKELGNSPGHFIYQFPNEISKTFSKMFRKEEDGDKE